MKSIKYPFEGQSSQIAPGSDEAGMIAPGMSVVFTIQFMAHSLQEQVDEIVIINEINAFKVTSE